jgi:hypothetical protein
LEKQSLHTRKGLTNLRNLNESSRALVVKVRPDVENQIGGLLKKFGLIIGKIGRSAYPTRVKELLMQRPILEKQFFLCWAFVSN